MQKEIDLDRLRPGINEKWIIGFPQIRAEMFASAGQLFHCQSSFSNTEEVNRLSVNYINVGLYGNQLCCFPFYCFTIKFQLNKTMHVIKINDCINITINTSGN